MLTAQVKDAETNENILRDRKLTSEFEIEARPGMRSTKVSQKLRQEKDRKNMTSEDTEYTKLVESLNDYLKEIFAYLSPELKLMKGTLLRQLTHRFMKSFISMLQRHMLMCLLLNLASRIKLPSEILLTGFTVNVARRPLITMQFDQRNRIQVFCMNYISRVPLVSSIYMIGLAFLKKSRGKTRECRKNNCTRNLWRVWMN